MLKKIVHSLALAAILLATPAFAFQTDYDTKICREKLAQFNYEVSYTNQMLLAADKGTHPQTGFLRHDDVFDKRIFLRAYAAEGSDAFYELPANADAGDCTRLEYKLSTGIGWLADYVISKDPDRCSKYNVCN